MPVTQGLDIRNPIGEELEPLTHYYDAEWVQTVNAADTLIFKCPNEYATNLIPANEVWVRRGDEAELVRKFTIVIIEKREGIKSETTVTAYDYSSLLMKVAVSEYPTVEPESGLVSVSAYLDYMMSLATAQTGIVWGTLPIIPGDKTELPYRDLHIKDSNVLAALHNVRQDIGGMLWVDNDKNLHWYIERFPTPPAAFALELDRNCIDVGVRLDQSTNESRVTWDVSVVDLSAHSEEDDGMLNIGMPVSVPVPGLGTTLELYITDIRQKLDNPLALEIAVNSTLDTTGRFRDIIDYFVQETDPAGTIDTTIENLDTSVNNIEEWLGDDLTDEDNFADAVTNQVAANVKLAKLVSLSAGGDTIGVYFYDYELSAWEEVVTEIVKPYELQKTNWNGQTLLLADGRSVAYDYSGLDLDYQRHAVCNDAGQEFDVVEELQPPYAVDGLLHVIRNADEDWMDANVLGRTYVWNAASVVDEGLVVTPPNPGDGGENADTSYLPLLYLAKVVTLYNDGDQIQVYLYNFRTNAWGLAARYIKKPYYLQASSWNLQTVTYTDGTQITYTAASLEKAYQRRATWTDSEEVDWTEVQEITPPYAVNEQLYVMQDRDGNLFDINTAGRQFAATTDAEEVGT